MRKYLSLLLLFFLLNFLPSFGQKKYNVIFISADDLSIGFDVYGNPEIPMPNFSRLMQHGTFFKQAYCQYPLCSPSRTSLLSGKRPDSTGIFDNIASVRSVLGADYKFLPEYFNSFGYRTEKFGKVGPCEHEEEVYWDYVYENHVVDAASPGNIPLWWIDTLHKKPEETRTGANTAKMIQKMEKPEATPYFYGLGLNTHNPFTPILESWNKIGDSSVKELLPVDIKHTLTNIIGNGSGNIILPNTPVDDTADIPPVAFKGTFFDFSPEEVQSLRHAYYGEILELDVHLGVLLDEIDSLNLWDSSIVIFWSDHGLQMGEHDGLWLKLTLFEESLRVPFIICAPGTKPGICNTPVELVDIFPTLTDLCGLPTPPDLEGSSLAPLLEKQDAPWKKAAFSQIYRRIGYDVMGRAVRTSQYHYNGWEDQGEELYDIIADPFEYTNLVTDPAHQADLNTMRNLLAEGWVGALPPVYSRKTLFKDSDGDGYGLENDSLITFFEQGGYATTKGDCEDANAGINPGMKEKACNGIDDNCNGIIDENKPKPKIWTLGNTDICQTGSVELRTSAPNQNFTFQWKKNDQNIIGATKIKYTARTPGTYRVEVTYKNACSNISDSIQVINSCGIIAIKNQESSNLSRVTPELITISPNPTPGNLNITYQSNTNGLIQLSILDITGRTVLIKNESAIKGSNRYQLNNLNLASGVYRLELINGKVTSHEQFVIQYP